MKKYHTIIIGGGPSGMAAALRCGKEQQRVLVLDRCDRLGKKLLVTGNGKCNLTNLRQFPECYRSNDKKIAQTILESFGYDETVELFHSLGIYTREKNGYVYPYNEQAAGVRQAFALALHHNPNVDIKTETEVNEIHPAKHGFSIETADTKARKKYICDSLLIATGGFAGVKLGCRGDGFRFARSLGHSVIHPLPSLTALKSSAPFLKKISGVRNQARIILKIDGQIAVEETGELQWTDYGISGVAVFQISRFAVRALEEKKSVELLVDFIPELETDALKKQLENMLSACGYKTSVELLDSLVPGKLSPVLIHEAHIDPDKTVRLWSRKDIHTLAQCLKQFSLRINGYAGYEKAQVTQGGVPLRELTPQLESRYLPGLFFSGEVVDVDGICGGYNLQWAFSSGSVAGQAMLERNRRLHPAVGKIR